MLDAGNMERGKYTSKDVGSAGSTSLRQDNLHIGQGHHVMVFLHPRSRPNYCPECGRPHPLVCRVGRYEAAKTSALQTL